MFWKFRRGSFDEELEVQMFLELKGDWRTTSSPSTPFLATPVLSTHNGVRSKFCDSYFAHTSQKFLTMPPELT